MVVCTTWGQPAPASTALHQGLAAIGPLPPKDGKGHDMWPCFTGPGSKDCPLPAGGLVVGVPVQVWPKCTGSKPCSQFYWTSENLAGNPNTGTAKLTLKDAHNKNVTKKLTISPGNEGPGTNLFVFADDRVTLPWSKPGPGLATMLTSTVFGTCCADESSGESAFDIAANPTQSVYQGIVGMAPPPPKDGKGNDLWPCFTGTADPHCSSLPSGALVVGAPVIYWSLASCTSAPCGQIYWTIQDVSLTGPATARIQIKQGKNVVYDSGSRKLGILTPDIYVFNKDGVQLGPNACSKCVTPVAGAASINITTTVNGKNVKGVGDIVLQ
jgi:hypothetical protein